MSAPFLAARLTELAKNAAALRGRPLTRTHESLAAVFDGMVEVVGNLRFFFLVAGLLVMLVMVVALIALPQLALFLPETLR